MRRARPASPRVSVFIDNRHGRAGVPARRSLEAWVALATATVRAPRAAAARALRAPMPQLNIALRARREARAINRQFRDRDYATNVLSFPYEPARHEAPGLLGDLVICPDVVAREAREQRKRYRDHFAHLVVHGVLHLLGYDHEHDADARAMESIERQLLESIGIPDPYAIV